MELSQFDFDLPSDLIADRPVSPRETSRMLVGLEPIQDAVFTDFTDYIGKKAVSYTHLTLPTIYSV